MDYITKNHIENLFETFLALFRYDYRALRHVQRLTNYT